MKGSDRTKKFMLDRSQWHEVLRPPVAGRIGLWAKTDSTSYFKDYFVEPK